MSAVDTQQRPNLMAPRMPDEWLEKALEVLKIPSTRKNELSMGLFLCNLLKYKLKIKYEIDCQGNIIVTKGQPLYPCFCAHLDTVHSYPDGFNIYLQEKEGHLYAFAEDDKKERVGTGGDDKCGIFACLYLLTTLENVKIIFFSSEESGGSGSNGIKKEIFKDCKFLGGIDRWNGSNFINKYNGSYTTSKNFFKDSKHIIRQYGYSYELGMFTDAFNVYGINLSCFNVSCGYYEHHSNYEYIDLNELFNACILCKDLASLQNRYEHTRCISTFGGDDMSLWNKYHSAWQDYYYNKYDNLTRISRSSFDNKKQDINSTSFYGRCKECNIELLFYERNWGVCNMCRKSYLNKEDNNYNSFS